MPSILAKLVVATFGPEPSNIALTVTTSTPSSIDRSRKRALQPRIEQLIAPIQLGFPFSVGPYPTPVARFRALARRTRFRNKGAFRVLGNIAMVAGWPFGALIAAVRALRQMREHHQTPHGLPVLLDMYWLALRHSIPPLEYSLYRFNDPRRRSEMHHYVYWNDLPGLAALNAKLGADNDDVQNKNRFARTCSERGFPHVETLAVFDRGRQIAPATPFVPIVPLLWVKALRLKGGAGSTKWTKDGENYRDTEGLTLSAAELIDRFREQDCIVQPFIENHPVIQRLSNGALASFRIVTGINERREAEYVASQLILPHGARKTSVAGIICSIASDSGRIDRAALPDGTPVTHHPDTNLPFAGTDLPFWRESIALVCRAHAASFEKFVFLGWDVAVTKDGPALLETNSGWGAIFHQMLDSPLGHTPFSRIVALHV